ncbi:DUF6600 domain-containing protein [Cyclobacterium qasimii]|nr:DUF6600 domain-containing protein [Cyclobacterium qasimii]
MKNTKSNRTPFSASFKIITLGLLMFIVGSKQNVNAAPISVSFQVFYDELSPYGDWIEDPNYGFIWAPYVDQSFQPYRTNGHWVMSTYGNTWVSQYDWGWAPFHYGRWFFSDFYGWAWIPGYDWGPAWVNWRSGRGYYGWMPLGPQTYFYSTAGYYNHSHWVFVPRRRLLSRRINRYYMHGRNANVIYNQTTIINNTYVQNNNRYISGPSRSELQQVTRGNVPVFEVTQGRRPGRTSLGRNSINVYRPQVSSRSSSRNEVSSRPNKYMSAKDYSKTRSTVARPSNSRSSTVASPRSSNVRSEALRNSNTPATRSARSAVNANTGRSNTQQRSVSPSTNTRSNSSASPNNNVIQRRPTTTPSRNESRSVTPNYQQNRRTTTTPSQRNSGVSTQKRETRQSTPTQRQVIKSTPTRSNSNTQKVTPTTRSSNRVQSTPQRSNARVKSNSSNSSRSQTRTTPKSTTRSTGSTTTTRSSRSSRGN